MTGSALVRRRGEDPSPLPEKVDVHFSEISSHRLVLQDDVQLGELASHLGYRIVVNPRDLRTHVQRILVCLRLRDENALRGSLVDLFIVLEGRGQALKLRMLETAAPILSKTLAAFLRRHLNTGFKPWDASISQVRMSLLSLGYIGTHSIIVKHERADEAANDPIATARACIEYGQLDVALETLEDALRINPEDRAIAEALLPIYERGTDPERAARMRKYLGGALNELPPGWESISEVDGRILHPNGEVEYNR